MKHYVTLAVSGTITVEVIVNEQNKKHGKSPNIAVPRKASYIGNHRGIR